MMGVPSVCNVSWTDATNYIAPNTIDKFYISIVQWLDNASSLDGQGVNEGDTLLLRKKFFILNDDVVEAIEGNNELKELIYQQVYKYYNNIITKLNPTLLMHFCALH